MSLRSLLKTQLPGHPHWEMFIPGGWEGPVIHQVWELQHFISPAYTVEFKLLKSLVNNSDKNKIKIKSLKNGS